MRPLVVDLSREYRGGQHQAFLLLKGLLTRGHTPELIAPRSSLLARRANEIGVTVYEVDPSCRRAAAALKIRSLATSGRIDLVHANEPHALTAAWLARAHRSVPIFAARRIALPLGTSRFSRARYRVASRIVAVSHFVEASVIQSGFPKEKIVVVHDGVAVPVMPSCEQRASARRRFGLAPETLCVANVAAFVNEKGHALLLRAFAKLRDQFPNCILLLSGDGPERKNIENLAHQLQLTNHVKFSDASEDVGEVLAAADVFAFPSHAEPLGSALLLAMAHGLPVLAVSRGGIPEIVENERNGLLVDSLDPAVFAAAMVRLITNRDEARRLGSSARESVLLSFSDDRMVDATLRVYGLHSTGTAGT